MKVTLLNTSILTDYGVFSYEPLTLAEAQSLVHNNHYESAIGHEATAEILTELLGVPVKINRIFHKQTTEDLGLVFKLRGRPEEGKILNRAEVETIGYDFGLLTKTS